MGSAARGLEQSRPLTPIDPIWDTLPTGLPCIFILIGRRLAATRARIGPRLPRGATLVWHEATPLAPPNAGTDELCTLWILLALGFLVDAVIFLMSTAGVLAWVNIRLAV